MGREEFLE
jgi:hypothetical protein